MDEGAQLGAYRVISRLGSGGMGEVWLAEHAMLGRRAAIKILRPELTSDEEIRRRFLNEARAATAIADPGIVQIFEFGDHTDGSAFIVMELLDGEALDERIRRLGALPLPDALRIARQVASTLAAAHRAGIIHRDLKPENIFLVRDPEVVGGERAKLLDFGIAKLGGSAQTSQTATSAVMGTPLYMSPEQCRGAGHVDARSDLYSLGCVLFALLTGTPPFSAEGVGDLIVAHMTEQAPKLSTRLPDVPRNVDALIARLLEKDPNNRFANASDLAAAMAGMITSPSISVRDLPMAVVPGTMTMLGGAATTPSGPPAMTPTAQSRMAISASDFDTTAAPPKRNAWVLVVVGASVVMGIAAFIAVRTMRDANAPTPEPEPAAAIPAADAMPAVVPAVAPTIPIDTAPAVPIADAAAVALPVSADAGATPMIAPADAAPVRQPKHLPRPLHRPKPGDDDIPDIR